VCVYIYKIIIHAHILCKYKLLFWMQINIYIYKCGAPPAWLQLPQSLLYVITALFEQDTNLHRGLWICEYF